MNVAPGSSVSTSSSHRSVTGSFSGTHSSWDCTSPDWRQHWVSRNELYCYSDFLQVMDAAQAAVASGAVVTDPHSVALAWGRRSVADALAEPVAEARAAAPRRVGRIGGRDVRRRQRLQRFGCGADHLAGADREERQRHVLVEDPERRRHHGSRQAARTRDVTGVQREVHGGGDRHRRGRSSAAPLREIDRSRRHDHHHAQGQCAPRSGARRGEAGVPDGHVARRGHARRRHRGGRRQVVSAAAGPTHRGCCAMPRRV